jgi:hypothetical protein
MRMAPHNLGSSLRNTCVMHVYTIVYGPSMQVTGQDQVQQQGGAGKCVLCKLAGSRPAGTGRCMAAGNVGGQGTAWQGATQRKE